MPRCMIANVEPVNIFMKKNGDPKEMKSENNTGTVKSGRVNL